MVAEGVAAGEFRCEHPDEARRAVVAACNAIPQWYDPAGPMGVDELGDRYVAIARRIVGCRP